MKFLSLKSLITYHLSLITSFAVLLTLFTLTLTTAPPAHAQVPCPDYGGGATPAQRGTAAINNQVIASDNWDDKPTVKNHFIGLVDAVNTGFWACSQLNPEINDSIAGTGAVALSGKLVALAYGMPPVSGVQYFAKELRELNPVKPAYAQAGTIGYDALRPTLDIWTGFRNISYVGFIITFIITGFMIMFRAHISPQAVATVQDSLPRIVIALILVTFSYAIAGLMIDIMFLLLNVIVNALRAVGLTDAGANNIFNKSVFSILIGSIDDVFRSVYVAISNIIGNTLSLPLALHQILGGVFGGIIGIIIGVAVLFIMFRVFIMLLMAYAMIVLLTIIAPFFFLVQALPGNNGARAWFQQMAANVSVFPITALMFLLAGMLGGIGDLGGSPAGGFIGPGDVGPFPLLAGDVSVDAVSRLIGIGFLLMTPTAAALVRDFIGAKGPQMGPAAFAAAGAAGATLGRPVGQLVRPFTAAGQFRAQQAAYGKLFGQRQPPTIAGNATPGSGQTGQGTP